MSDNKYKDSLPQETIAKTQEILSLLRIEYNETIHSPIEGLYSMRLNFPSLDWGVNGKGTTEDFCRASAYGEAMERIQNLHFPGYLTALVEHREDVNFEFHYFPDEQRKKISISNIHEDLLSDMKNSFYQSDNIYPDDKQLISVWNKWNNEEKFSFVPFYSVKYNSIQKLPYEVILRLCRSNGIASGNTLEEALCQALSEVLERHVQENIIRKRLAPPEIPVEYIKKVSPELLKIIEIIESKGNFKLLVFDGSLGIGLPVVCVALVDKTNQMYRVKFGCHPIFSIALERCLTELYQGCSSLTGEVNSRMIHFDKANQLKYNTRYNWSTMFRENKGSIPYRFFFKKPRWNFMDWEEHNDYSNKKGASWLIDKCLSIAPDIYIRNHSYLGFPTVRVYVPGISPVYKFNPLGRKHQLSKHLVSIIDNLKDYADSMLARDKIELINYFSGDYHSIYEERLDVSVPILLAALYLDLRNSSEALDSLFSIEGAGSEFSKSPVHLALQSLYKEKSPSKFIQAVICELEMLEEGISEQDRDRILDLFFGLKYRMYVSINWRSDNVVSGLFEPFKPKEERGGFNAKKLSLTNHIACLIMMIKDRMFISPINQRESIVKQRVQVKKICK